jgi:hypothetical protein
MGTWRYYVGRGSTTARRIGSTCCGAAAGGHLDVLRWALEHNCPWDWMTCHDAVGNGRLAVLQWARAHDCPWIKRQCSRDHPQTLARVRLQPE